MMSLKYDNAKTLALVLLVKIKNPPNKQKESAKPLLKILLNPLKILAKYFYHINFIVTLLIENQLLAF